MNELDESEKLNTPVDWNKMVVYRYIDWSITTPIMLLVLMLYMGNNLKIPVKLGTYIIVLLLNYIMLAFGFLGETKGGDPIPMRPIEVNRMLGKVDELSLETENISIPFNIGDNVKVIDGPFNGFNGSIEKVNEEKRKLEVMVKIFGRKTPLELSYMQVEKS